MNFLRSSPTVAAEQPSVHGSNIDTHKMSRSVTTLEGLIAEDSFPPIDSTEDSGGEAAKYEDVAIVGSDTSSDASLLGKHLDVSEEDGWITIPSKKLHENWSDAPDVHSLRSLDRSFVFPGEQIHVLACLSANEQDMEIITPFKVAAVMSKNGIGQSGRKVNGLHGNGTDALSDNAEVHADGQDTEQNGVSPLKGNCDTQKGFSAGESLLRMEDQKRKTETLLQKFKSSHFFVRIAESNEMLWSKRGAHKTSSHASVKDDQSSTAIETTVAKDMSRLNAIVDKGNFDANVSGGVARNTVQCHSLANGDVVVLLQVNVGVNLSEDPVLEILQFEKHQTKNVSSHGRDDVLQANQEPCGELLTWLLPLDNTLSPPPRSLSPPPLTTNPGIGSTSQRPNLAGTSGSQLFSFGNFRSYSMSALPQNTAPPPAPVTTPSSKPKFELEDWDRLSYQKFVTNQKTDKEELLSFRGVSLEPERFSVCCGLEGVYIPGRRWRRKLEIIQPIEIHSFGADCNTDDLLCVQIKNVSPAHISDVIVYIDAITIVLEEAVKGGPPLSLPIASIEAGDEHSLPNLALRHSNYYFFINLKPAISAWKKLSAQDRKGTQSSQLMGGTASTLRVSSKIIEGKSGPSASDNYAVMVSCHCNYTESRLFFKQPTSWRPRISRDIMISVASEMSRECPGPNGMVPQLPVQVLTLQASNLTSEDLTMTILAPASFSSPPSVLSLNSSPSSPISPFLGLSEVAGKYTSHTHGSTMQKSSVVAPSLENKSDVHGETKLVSFNEQASPVSDAISTSSFGCTHLWLHSRVPLGCVPSQTTATIKLELLPLTDGIITLDTLQIDVKEKGDFIITLFLPFDP
ncbi:hypothetical protein BT93_B2692 [Corymbia citriodora subsp. variegata]|nr:hypothetical protein BT93_B2692 [Corymbia citriodora subsp. variegata]